MLYANPIFAELLEQCVYRPANAEQRSTLSPMPLPALALVVTAVECALQEWETGIKIRISFTEEAYARIYRSHLKRLERLMITNGQLLGSLLDNLYDYCVGRNTILVPHIGDEDETFDDYDFLNSDMESNDGVDYDIVEHPAVAA